MFCSAIILFIIAVASRVEGGISAAEQDEIVNVHNKFRAAVQPTASNMEKMQWNAKAAAKAQAFADSCSKELHDNAGGCGQNSASASGHFSWKFVVRYWHSEVKVYKYGVGGNLLKKVGHYTQVVWATSAYIGCGYAVCDGGSRHKYVCNYCPPGNRGLAHPYKSGVPGSDCAKGTADSEGLCPPSSSPPS